MWNAWADVTQIPQRVEPHIPYFSVQPIWMINDAPLNGGERVRHRTTLSETPVSLCAQPKPTQKSDRVQREDTVHFHHLSNLQALRIKRQLWLLHQRFKNGVTFLFLFPRTSFYLLWSQWCNCFQVQKCVCPHSHCRAFVRLGVCVHASTGCISGPCCVRVCVRACVCARLLVTKLYCWIGPIVLPLIW